MSSDLSVFVRGMAPSFSKAATVPAYCRFCVPENERGECGLLSFREI